VDLDLITVRSSIAKKYEQQIHEFNALLAAIKAIGKTETPIL
jgi:hypothetical protein